MSRPAPTITLNAELRQVLESRSRSRTEPHQRVQRARLVLAAAKGESNGTIAAQMGMSRQMVGTWRQRFQAEGLAELEDRARPRARRPFFTSPLHC